jgi:branched-chain amino acid transport system permease protein
VQLAVNIVVLAAIYALIACGYVLVYRVSRVLNLAHGELMMLGAYLLLMTATQFSSHWLVAILAAVLLSLLTGVLVYVFLMRKMTGEMVLAAVLTTVALGILLRGVMVLVWSAQQQYPAQPLQITNFAIALPGGARISLCAAVLVCTTAFIYSALLLFLRFGRWGVRMRAAGQNPLLAAQRGVNLHAIYALAWGLSTLTGALAGMLIALDSGLGQTMAIIGLKAFPAALVGGLDSLVGALAGSLIVAAAEVLLINYVDPLLSEVVPFLVLIAMLVVRPWGLLGTREELDRV